MPPIHTSNRESVSTGRTERPGEPNGETRRHPHAGRTVVAAYEDSCDAYLAAVAAFSATM